MQHPQQKQQQHSVFSQRSSFFSTSSCSSGFGFFSTAAFTKSALILLMLVVCCCSSGPPGSVDGGRRFVESWNPSYLNNENDVVARLPIGGIFPANSHDGMILSVTGSGLNGEGGDGGYDNNVDEDVVALPFIDVQQPPLHLRQQQHQQKHQHPRLVGFGLGDPYSFGAMNLLEFGNDRFSIPTPGKRQFSGGGGGQRARLAKLRSQTARGFGR